MKDPQPNRPGHSVLAGADAGAYRSLRVRPVSRAERFALGRKLRDLVPRSAMAHWQPPANRPDPIGLIERANRGRLPGLIPMRVARMAASPYGFLRGTAELMADDFSRLPATGIRPIVCGDAHLGNFGLYASPERNLVIDVNDFDEAHPGPWEWDLRRLATSIWVAGRQNGASDADCQLSAAACIAAYRRAVRVLAREPLLARSYQVLDVNLLKRVVSEKSLRTEVARAVRVARSRTSDRTLPRLTTGPRGNRRIVDDAPLVTHPTKAASDRIAAGLDAYLQTLAPHWRQVVGGYTLIDVAHKVVGISSVGLRCYVALLEGSSPDDVLFLQLKQARRSALARYVHGDTPQHAHQGQRVVEYQQALQTVSDPLLGWTTIDGLAYYVRQFRDMKGTIALDAIDAPALADYARIVGQLLAKAHARTSGASMIAGYAGGSDKLEQVISRFARAYADQVEADHAALVRAVKNGTLRRR
jgi:uncharacterized protein (DUF2252 family)